MWVLHPVSAAQRPSPSWSPQTHAAQPFPGPHAQRDSSPHFPEEVQSNSARPPAAPALTGLLREAGGASRGGSDSGRAGAGGGHSAPRGIVSKIRPLRASRKQLIRPRLQRVTPAASQWGVEPQVPGWAAARDGQECMNLPLETLQGAEQNFDPREKRNWCVIVHADSVPNASSGSTGESLSPFD